MTAVFSSTYDPLYQFFIPIAAYSWRKLGVDSVCFMPWEGIDVNETKRWRLTLEYSPDIMFPFFKAPINKQATYTQLSRLFAGAISNIPDDEWLITSDVDMAVFSTDLVFGDYDATHVWGKDLVPDNQMAMCYVRMPKWKWRQVMDCGAHSYQQMLDLHLGHIECDHFRGNYWGYDQEQLSKHVGNLDYISHPRAHPGTQFAQNRCDRDDANWQSTIGPSLFDAHLWRPGYEDNNFEKIITLFSKMYPEDDLTWMREYREKFIQLL